MSNPTNEIDPGTHPGTYNAADYDRPSVTVDVVIFSLSLDDDDLRVLLMKRQQWPHAGQWALPGGFVQLGESLDQSAARQLQTKAGIDSVYLEQLYTFGDVNRDPRTRVLTIAYFALVPMSAVQIRDDEDSHTAWFSIFDLPALAFDHRAIIDYAYTRLRYKLEYTTVGFDLLPDQFTLTELQRAYQIILREKLDKRNFRRKILQANILEETGDMFREGEGRPAKLYRYLDDAMTEVKTRRLFP